MNQNERRSIEMLAIAIIRDFRITRWLAAECLTMIRASGIFFPLAGLGLLVRLMVIDHNEDDREFVMAKICAGDSHDKRIHEWWQEKRTELWTDLESAAIDMIASMTIELRDLHSLKGEDLRAAAEKLLIRRDDLESIVHLVGKDADRLLRPVLIEIDRVAQENRSFFNSVEGDSRLWAVSYSWPEAWWATVVVENFDRKEGLEK